MSHNHYWIYCSLNQIIHTLTDFDDKIKVSNDAIFSLLLPSGISKNSLKPLDNDSLILNLEHLSSIKNINLI